MKVSKINLIAATIGLLIAALPVLADPGDTTYVTAFNQEFVNWADPHVATFEFPAADLKFTEINLHITVGCPGAPGDCDPWDRLALLHILVPTSDTTNERYEIARFITPYDITGGGGPGTCGWDFDATDYQTLLHDSVTLSLYITTWIGGSSGWLITTTFRFIEGQPDPEPYRVVNLWDIGYLVFGDPDNPPEDHIQPIALETDPFTELLMVRTTCTGHGQGNTANAAEFSNMWHRLSVGIAEYQHQLWRDDCATNPCHPQGGTWRYNRAGWCPGASVPPWDNFYNDFAPGETVDFYYDIQPYENLCRPTNPNCVSGQTCTDCQYNSTGHTEPNYCLMAQAVFFRAPTSAVGPSPSAAIAESPVLEQNYPNPFNPTTTIRFSLPSSGIALMKVYNIAGQEVERLVESRLSAGAYEVNFDGSDLSAGVYIYTLDFHDVRIAQKMLLLK